MKLTKYEKETIILFNEAEDCKLVPEGRISNHTYWKPGTDLQKRV